MKRLLPVLILSMLLFSCKTTYIYLVRHGEKATTPADNPHLTTEGNNRAQVLKTLLAGKNVKHVYATNFHRTQETGKPTADAHGLTVETYGSDTLNKFVAKVKAIRETQLIVGHSNTVISMLDLFPVSHVITNIPENDFDNLFVIKFVNGKIKGFTEKTYGATSP